MLIHISGQYPKIGRAKWIIYPKSIWSSSKCRYPSLKCTSVQMYQYSDRRRASVTSLYVMYMSCTMMRSLTHWGRDKMDAIFQTTFSNGFYWMKMYEFQLKFHWSLLLKVQLTISQHWVWRRPGDKPLSEPNYCIWFKLHSSVGIPMVQLKIYQHFQVMARRRPGDNLYAHMRNSAPRSWTSTSIIQKHEREARQINKIYIILMVFYWMRNKRTEIDMKILDYQIWTISLKITFHSMFDMNKLFHNVRIWTYPLKICLVL